jgi:hypothetical protein
LRLALSEKEMQFIVFAPGEAIVADPSPIETTKSKMELSGDWDFELKPSQDNRWGDYHWPPTPALIGAEARSFRYRDETPDASGWEQTSFNDEGWRTQTYSYGPQFWKLGPLPAGVDTRAVEQVLAAADCVDPAIPVRVGDRDYRWTLYDFSWRFGVEGDPGYQGYHGLKERLYDEYIRLGRLVDKHTAYQREAEPAGTRYYLWTSVSAADTGPCKLLHGGTGPAAAWLNDSALSPTASQAELRAGANRLLLRYDRPGTGHFTFVTLQSSQKDSPPPGRNPEQGLTLGTLAMRWNSDPTVLRFDVRPSEKLPAGWYRFISAPGLRALDVTAYGTLTAWADGVPCTVTPGAHRGDGAIEYRVAVASRLPKAALVALRLVQERGRYGGAAIPEPVKQHCGVGNIALGDWGTIGGLRCYSGGAWYRKTFILPTQPIKGNVVIDLGHLVSTAELRLNGKRVGIEVAPPWRWNVTDFVRPSANRIEVLIYNTLANH